MHQNNKNKKDNKSNEEKSFFIPNFKEDYISSCHNFKLLLDKYIPFYKTNNKNKGIFDLKETKDFAFNNLQNPNIQKICNNLLETIKSYQKMITNETFSLTTKSRLIVGLGTTSVLEVSIRLHHIYGIPYIPSSAIKGILRAYNILKIVNFDMNQYKKVEEEIESIKEVEKKDLNKLNQKEIIVKLFGNQNFQGELIVLDAYPENCQVFEKDIINVHFKDYYQDKKAPQENHQLTPITFLTLKKGTKFNFYFKNSDLYKSLTKRDLKEDLKEATKYLGLGAKSSLGYGVLGD
ncbi:type III-B CRISPR module RAMP protein Cmr6 [Sulfurihydrogenibium sp.]|uniref:type III-B CRISPR module RAMP protein Cmr6 n=1 Tax=Sulfurihydrogenibium sp. TaxID=2053621 RepID=UPI003D0E8288